MSHIINVCVFCGSKFGSDPKFKQSAVLLGKTLAEKKLHLVYGGGKEGLTGSVAKAAHDNGADVIGILPKAFKEVCKPEETPWETEIVDTMHERKAKMMDLADTFIVLPGGFGTLEELFEVVSWLQLEIHRKPIGLLNINGYFDLLLSFLDNAVAKQFMTAQVLDLLISAPDVKGLLNKLKSFVFPLNLNSVQLDWPQPSGNKKRRSKKRRLE